MQGQNFNPMYNVLTNSFPFGHSTVLSNQTKQLNDEWEEGLLRDSFQTYWFSSKSSFSFFLEMCFGISELEHRDDLFWLTNMLTMLTMLASIKVSSFLNLLICGHIRIWTETVTSELWS